MNESAAPEDASRLRRQLFAQTWPMAMGVLSLLGLQLVDAAFVGHLGTQPLAAQSFTFPLTFLMTGTQVGFGIAVAALISRAIGGGEPQRAKRMGTLVLVGCSAFMGVLTIVLWLAHGPIFRRMGVEPDVMALLEPYWAVQLVANWLSALLYFGYTLFRAHNRTRLPGAMMVLTSVCNLLLDPLLIFGWGPIGGFGLPGAAMATTIAFVIGLSILTWQLARADWLARTGLRAEVRRTARPFLGIAGPAMLSQLMPPLSAMLATAFVATLGDAAVAAWGLQSRVETMSLMLVLGLTMSLPPWLGHCYGSGNWQRIRALMRIALQSVVVWQLCLGVVVLVVAPWVAQLLSSEAEVRAGLVPLMRFMLPSYALLGICMVVVSAMNALGWPLRAMFISVGRLFLCYLPCVALGVYVGGSMLTTGAGALAGNCLAGVLAWLSYRASMKQKGKTGVSAST